MNGLQNTTGTVHLARKVTGYSNEPQLGPACSGTRNLRYYLTETERPVNCTKCIRKIAKRELKKAGLR